MIYDKTSIIQYIENVEILDTVEITVVDLEVVEEAMEIFNAQGSTDEITDLYPVTFVKRMMLEMQMTVSVDVYKKEVLIAEPLLFLTITEETASETIETAN